MKLFQRLFMAAILAGLVAGLGMAALHQWRTVPLILEAETYEAAGAESGHAHDAAAPAHQHDHAAADWAPADGLERTAYTVAADVLAALGFALMLGAVSVLTGLEVTPRNGVLWGLAGFVSLQLAPAFGLAPELPGMPAADLVARQIWWLGCALATATAIFGVAKFRNWPALVIGLVLVGTPHVIGAPQAPDAESAVPAHLATAFASSTQAIGAAFWLGLGAIYGLLTERFSRPVETNHVEARA